MSERGELVLYATEGRVRKADVAIAKNYPHADELESLIRLVSRFLDFAELRAQQRQNMRMAEWRTCVDSFMSFNERPLFAGTDRVSHEAMANLAHERYEQFDATRRAVAVDQADRDDLRALELLGRQLSASTGPSKDGEDAA